MFANYYTLLAQKYKIQKYKYKYKDKDVGNRVCDCHDLLSANLTMTERAGQQNMWLQFTAYAVKNKYLIHAGLIVGVLKTCLKHVLQQQI